MDSARSSVNPSFMPPPPVIPKPLTLPLTTYGYQIHGYPRSPPTPGDQQALGGLSYNTVIENAPSRYVSSGILFLEYKWLWHPFRIIEYVAIFLSWVMTIMFFPFAVCTCYKVVREYERAVIFRMGRLREGAAKGPGTLFILPCVDSCYVLDLRTVTFDVPPQEILTHDAGKKFVVPNSMFTPLMLFAVTVAVDAVVSHCSKASVSIKECLDLVGLLQSIQSYNCCRKCRRL